MTPGAGRHRRWTGAASATPCRAARGSPGQDGAWNEWFMVAGERVGWLAEAQGFLSARLPSRSVPPELAAGRCRRWAQRSTIDGARVPRDRPQGGGLRRQRGRAAVRGTAGRTARYLDMVGADGGFAGLEELGGGTGRCTSAATPGSTRSACATCARSTAGRRRPPAGDRRSAGMTARYASRDSSARAGPRLSCPNCGSPVEHPRQRRSASPPCAGPAAHAGRGHARLRVIAEAQARTRTPTIPIGTRGTLVGTEWEVVGFQDAAAAGRVVELGGVPAVQPLCAGSASWCTTTTDWTLYGMLRQDVPRPRPDRRRRPALPPEPRRGPPAPTTCWASSTGACGSATRSPCASSPHPPYLLSREARAEEVTWSRGVQLPARPSHAAFGLAHAAAPPTRDRAARSRADARSGRCWRRRSRCCCC